MGWAGGSGVFDDIYAGIRQHIPKNNRKQVVEVIFEALENADCDTLDECRGRWKEVDAVLDERYPPEDDE